MDELMPLLAFLGVLVGVVARAYWPYVQKAMTTGGPLAFERRYLWAALLALGGAAATVWAVVLATVAAGLTPAGTFAAAVAWGWTWAEGAIHAADRGL